MSFPIHVSVLLERGGQILLVQEGDPADEKRWNLPGGHLEPGEGIRAAARREVLEETGLEMIPLGILGIYSDIRPPRVHAIRFVLIGQIVGGVEQPGDDILALRWLLPEDVLAAPVEELHNPALLRRIAADAGDGAFYPLDLLVEPDAKPLI